MAFDQNSIPKDLRPLNIARNLPEEPRIVAATATANTSAQIVRNPEFLGSPEGSIPVIYPATVSDAGFVGLGYGKPVQGVSPWGPLVPVQVGTMNAAAVGFSYSPNPNLGNRVVSNAVDHAGNDLMAGFGVGVSPNSGNRVNANGSNELASSGIGYNLSFGSRGSAGSGVDHGSEDGGDDSASGKKVKLLCSFGGRILPRPSDGMLRYVGGQTRIISVRRDVSFNELLNKMMDSYGQPVAIKYQLPDEDLDALVSVSCPDDLDNMMDEYEKLVERSSDGSAKLRVFLFPASQLDASGTVQYGDLQDSGQRYVEAVNGIMDGFGSGITRKGSIASASSTQNSDFSGTEALDSSGPGHADVASPPSTAVYSPRENSTTASDTTSKLPTVDPNPPVYVADASAMSFGVPLVKSGPPQTLCSQPEVEYEMPAPISASQQQMGYDFQQAMMGIPSHASTLQTFVDPRQEFTNPVDYVHASSQMYFPNTQIPGTVGSVPIQHHFHVNNAGVTPRQFIPMQTVTASPSHVSMRPTVLQPSVQSHPHHDDNTFGTRIVQLPVDPSYTVYHAQPPPTVGGGYTWRQVPQSEHVFSDGLVHPQQLNFPEKIQTQRLEDCHMCQKALPHAHSDTVAQEQKRECGVGTLLDTTSVHQSLARPVNKATGALVEGITEKGIGRPSVPGHTEHQMGTTKADATGFPQNLEELHENQRTTLLKNDAFDQSKASAPTGMMCLPGELQSPYGIFMGGIPQSQFEDSVQQQYMTNQNRVKQESKPIVNSPLHTAGVSEKLVHGIVDSCASYDQLRPIDVKMQNLHLCPPEIIVNAEHSQPPVDASEKEEILEYRTQHIGGRELLLDNTLHNPQVVLEPNHIKQTEVQPVSAGVSYAHISRPLESYEVAQQSVLSNPGSYPQSQMGSQLLDSADATYGVPGLSGVDPGYVMDRIPPVVEGRTDASRMQPKIVSSDVESLSSAGNKPSSPSTFNPVGDVQDSSNSLFSNQDPWSMRNDNHYPPPKPMKIATKARDLVKDVLLEDEVAQTPGNSNKDFSPEHVHSAKGSAEELIRQELQAVAEGVAAASVFQSVATDESSQDTEVSNKNVEMQHKAKFEDMKKKIPASQGIGRLQIISNADLEELRELGSGTFGTVYHGKWRGTDVAIKRINDRCFAGKPSEQERMVDDFWNEAIKLADLHHPNVVAFYGIVLDGPGGSVATVTEYMVNGSLRNALQKNERSLDKRKRLFIAMDVAFGMEYLHGKNIVHFDLKSDNLLVNLRDPHRPICKVGDLGLSKVKCQTLISGGVRGTLPWMAPELLNGSSSLVSEKVDVFSFGIVLWELLTGEEPYADLHYGAIIGGIVSNTLRPPVPDSCDLEWRSLMERCWSAEPSDRPNFTEIANELRVMAARSPSKGHNPAQQQHPSAQPQVQK
ncbi:hypothetical protein Tsubulata_045564 [Turnera subulata]|uniref:Protein kinase domain-containing protein n=1 Tax=Turnera subulata TaxID=218843 RepID=A0A9Q0FJS9_9ROSI|nr:hypothetical protein Tsubulata_045564 [Turnera subulata]